MALIRAEVRNRLGDSSIYDCVVESLQDFSTEPMLDRIHTGSIALCLNLDSQNGNNSEEQGAPVCYIKSSDGSWKPGSISNAHLMNLMESLMAQKIMGLTGSGSVSPAPGYTSINSGEFILAQDTYDPAPIDVPVAWDHMLIWTEETFMKGKRNIHGAILWKDSNDIQGSILPYKVLYTNLSGVSGVVSQALFGGGLYTANGNELQFGADVSFGVYAAGVKYKWIAWKEAA